LQHCVEIGDGNILFVGVQRRGSRHSWRAAAWPT